MEIEEITKLVEESVTSEVFGVWFLIGVALAFFMQAGFVMVDTGEEGYDALQDIE